jgi:two-component system, cell cycle sensor histidine kinase and response regulator CckA
VEVTRHVETILVVDDEDHVRVIARGMLETKGYTVLDTGDPQMALHWVKSGVCFHLLLVDVVMPRMKGTELANRLKTLSPQTKVLLMSGYVVSGVAGYPLIAKPFTGDQLAERVREVLTRPSPFARPRS